MNKLYFGIGSLLIIMLIGIFLFIFYDQIIDEYYITPLDNISNQVANDLNFDQQWKDTLGHLKNQYDARNIPYDIFFIVMFLITFVSTSWTSLKARKHGILSFFGLVFLGSMAFLVMMFFIEQFTSYFFEQIFIPIFSDTVVDTPIINWFFNNINLIAFIWFLWLLLLNQLDIRNIIRSDVDSGGFQR